MRSTQETALIAEVAVCFLPAGILFSFWCIGFLTNLGNAHQSVVEQLEPVVFLLAGGAGLVAATSLLWFVLVGRKLVRSAQLLVCAIAGLCLSGWVAASFIFSGYVVFALIPAAPLFCGLHLLYLGRSYFTRKDA
jgi:hypothetical protein